MTSTDFRDFYYLESYLFDTVRCRFAEQGYLDAFDLFCIVIWKMNRSKSKIARRLLDQSGCSDLDVAVRQLTEGIARKPDAKERLRYLWLDDTWGLRLPMASAILTVLYPDEFTMYDRRVCEQVGGFYNLAYLTNFDAVWRGYQDFKRAVENLAPAELSLRDKDRYLWGKSFHDQLREDIAQRFGVDEAQDN